MSDGQGIDLGGLLRWRAIGTFRGGRVVECCLNPLW